MDDLISEAEPRSIVGIGSFRDQVGLLDALHRAFGVHPPSTPGFVQAGEVTLARLAPTRFLASGPRGAALARRLAANLAGKAALTDQSDQWVVFTLRGQTVRAKLARIVPIDLDPSAFGIGALALTRAGHLDVRLARVAEDQYEIAAARSYAADLRHALC